MGIYDLFSGFIYPALDAVRNSIATSEQQLYAKVMTNFKDSNLSKVSSLYIDANSIIYDAIGAAYFMDDAFSITTAQLSTSASIQMSPQQRQEAIAKVIGDQIELLKSRGIDEAARSAYEIVFNQLVELIKTINPTTLVFIAFDGCAPWAKIMNQRGRRYESAQSRNPNDLFDRAAITPGTYWMTGLMNYLTEAFTDRRNSGGGPTEVVISTSNRRGEGEHKIIDKILSNMDFSDPLAKVVFGNDADLLLLLLLTSRKNLYLCRKFNFQTLRDRAASLDLYSDFVHEAVVDINEIGRAFKKHINNEIVEVDSFIYALSLLGNDFLPRPYACRNSGEAINTIMKVLSSLQGPLTRGNELQYRNILEFFRLMADNERRLVEDRYRVINNVSPPVSASIVNNRLDYSLFPFNWYKYALDPRNKDFAAYLKLEVNYAKGAEEMSRLFLQGMSWVYAYYTHSKFDVSETWFYYFSYAPLISDLYQYLSLYQDVLDYPRVTTKPTIPYQLIAVMPPSSVQEVPRFLHKLWDYNSPLVPVMPIRIVTEVDEDIPKHAATKIMPFVSIGEIDTALTNFKRLPEFTKLETEVADLSLINTRWKPTISETPRRGALVRTRVFRGRK